MKKLISIVAPMYNEESLVHAYCEETLNVCSRLGEKYIFEIVLVNDGSKDKTYELMIEEQNNHSDEISIICLSRNFGLEGAVNAGLQKASGDAVVVMDADLQDPPSLIIEMIEKWEMGADIVIASRSKRSTDNFFKRMGANFYYKVLNILSGKLKLEKSAANYRLLSRQAVDKLLELPEVNRVFRVVTPYIGMKTDIVEYERDKRFAGKTKYSLKTMIPYAMDSITGISIEPLRKIKILILPVFLLFVFSLVAIIFTQDVWRLVWLCICMMSILSTLTLGALAIMSEYIALIVAEVKGRPTSIIYEFHACNNVEKIEDKI